MSGSRAPLRALVLAVVVVASCNGSDGAASTIATPPGTVISTTATPGSTSPTPPQIPVEPAALVTSEPLPLPEALTTATEGMVLAGYELARGEDGQELWGEPWIGTVIDGSASRIVADACYWDGWYLTPPYPVAADGIFLGNGEGLVVCSPGDEVHILAGRAGILGTAVIGGEEQGLLATQDGLALLGLPELDMTPFAELDLEQAWPIAASYGGGRLLTVLESTAGPTTGRVRNTLLLDEAGKQIDLDLPAFTEEDDPHLASAAISSDGSRLWLAVEFSDGTTDLVSTDLDSGEELTRTRVLDSFVPGDDPYGFGREFVYYMDTSGDRVLLGLATVEAENYLSGVLLVEADRVVHELSAVDGYGVIAASFIDEGN
jgi:hypothetical protein